jgi:hypothetical protein
LRFSPPARLKVHEPKKVSPVSEELETAQAIEQSLLLQLAAERSATQAVRDGVESDLRNAQDSIQSLRNDNNRLDTTLREERAAMIALRSEFNAGQRKMSETLTL